MENMESKCTGLGRGGDAGLARKTQVLTVNLRMTMRSKMSEPMLQHTFLSLLKHFKALKCHWHRRDYMAAQHMSIQHGPSMVKKKRSGYLRINIPVSLKVLFSSFFFISISASFVHARYTATRSSREGNL